jgi:hypothetical protein
MGIKKATLNENGDSYLLALILVKTLSLTG